MLLLSASERGELSLVRFEGVSEERKAGWLAGWLRETGCVCVCLSVYAYAAGGMVRGRDREAGCVCVCEETVEVV